MQKMRRMMAVVLILVLGVLCLNDNVFAQTYGNKASSGKYAYVGYRQFGKVGFWTYKNSGNWIAYYPNSKLTPVIRHGQYSGSDALTFSCSVTQSRTKTSSWSANANISKSMSVSAFGIFERAISASIGLGYGESYARDILLHAVHK